MGYLLGIDEEVRDLLAELRGDLDLRDPCCLGFEEELALAALEEAEIGYL